jgi:serine protease inhibitor ecotin
VSTGVVVAVDFETYVKVVMPAEWPSTWPIESMRAGAVAIKQYAWYYTMHYRGGTGTGGCYDVRDDNTDQVYSPAITQYPSQIQAVESTWSESITKSGVFVFTGYRPGTNVACGTDADGYHLFQRSALNCAIDGKTGEEILQIYYGPGLVIQAPTTYHALTPARVLDCRDGTGLSGSFSSNVARTFTVTGHGGVPANATAVTGNLTVTQQTSLGYLYMGPNATNNPTSSTLNFPLGDDRANAVTVALGAGGTLSVTYVAVPGASAQVIFDVTGYFTPDTSGATYHALTPARILDSRDGYWIGLAGAFSSHVARTFGVAGRGGVPGNATAVTGNLTVTQQSNLGYLYVGPNATNDPTSSTLNFPLGDDRANAVTVALGAGGTLSVTYVAVPGASAQVIFDVTGYFTPDGTGATYVALTPARVLDSRDGYWIGLSGASSSHVARTFTVTGHGGVPSTAIAVTGNLTVTGQTALGYLYVGPNAMDDPTSSTINFPLGDDRANAVTVALGAGGTLSVTYVAVPGATAQVIFDVTGYFTP